MGGPTVARREWKGHGKNGFKFGKDPSFFYKDISKIMLNMPARGIMQMHTYYERECTFSVGLRMYVFSKILIVTLFSAMSLSLKFHFHCGIIWKIELYFLLASTVSSSAAELFPWDYRYLWQYDGNKLIFM